LSRSFRIECGIRQGDSLSTLLFNSAPEKVVRNMEISRCGAIFNRIRQFIAYADNVAIIGRTVGALNEVYMQLQRVAVFTGLVINTDKSKYIKTTETINVGDTGIELHRQNFKRVDTFKYLNSIITSLNETEYKR
jgi:hypothetical protein